jgi:cell division protein ZapA
MDSGGSEKKPARVTIFHQPYTLRSSGEPGELEELARSVDALMSSIASKTGEGDPARVAVLACLHMADRLGAMERRLAELKQRIDDTNEKFTVLLERALEEPVLPSQSSKRTDIGD